MRSVTAVPAGDELVLVERWLNRGRAAAAVFAIAAVAATPSFPDPASEMLAWACVALVVGTVLLVAAFTRRSRSLSLRGRQRLGAVAMASDCLVVTGFVLTFAYETTYVTWSLVILAPIEGAVRYGAAGAIGAAVWSELTFLAQAPRRAATTGIPIGVTEHVYVLGLIVIVTAATAILVIVYQRQREAYRVQALALADLDRVKNRLLAVTSHEFRGSLGAIVSGVETLRRHGDRLPTDHRDHTLGLVAQQSRHLSRLVDDLLSSTQVAVGSFALSTTEQDLAATVETALDAASPARRNHELNVQVDDAQCVLDHERLQQVLRNLVENAYKYSPDGSTVTVSARHRDGTVRLKVTDEGNGIPEADRERVFLPFQRQGSNTGGVGAGLGLYVVDRVVTAMGGRVVLLSGTSGSTFLVTVPCADESAQPTADDTVSETDASPRERAAGRGAYRRIAG